METTLLSVFEAEAKAASASPANVVYTVTVLITSVAALSKVLSVAFILVASLTFMSR